MQGETAGEAAASGIPRIGLRGCFDLESFGAVVAVRVLEAELKRRAPGADVRAFAPFGRPTPLDGGRPAETLAARSGAELDLVVVGPGEVVSFDDAHFARLYQRTVGELAPLRIGSLLLEAATGPDGAPIAWSSVGVPHDLHGEEAARVRNAAEAAASVSVRDERSRSRLLAAGVERAIEVVPEPALLCRDLFSRELLARRLEYLRWMERLPRTGRALVVHGGEPLERTGERIADLVKDAAARHADVALVVVALGPEDRERVETFAARLPGPVHVLADGATLTDLAAVLSSAALVVTSSPEARAAAIGFGVPTLPLEPAALGDLSACLSGAAPPTEVRELERRLEAHLDGLAEIAVRSAWDRLARRPSPWRDVETTIARAERRLASSRSEHDLLRTLLARERLRFSEANDAERRQRAHVERDVERLDGELRAMRAEFGRVLNLRLFRYTAPARALYRRLRGLVKRS